MATAVPQAKDRELSIGRVFSRGFGAIGAHPIAILGLALVLGALPQMIIEILLGQAVKGATIPAVIVLFLAGSAFNMVAAVLVQGTVVLTVVAHSEGLRPDIADTLPPALIRFLMLMLLGLVIGLGDTFGLVLLIVPGLMLYIIWWVAAPVLVVERLGVIEALSRSSELTRGGRWKIFGVELILGVGSGLIELALRAVGVNWPPFLSSGFVFDMSGSFLLAAGVMILVRTLGLGVYAAMHASFYVELREWKDGPATDALAEVFG